LVFTATNEQETERKNDKLLKREAQEVKKASEGTEGNEKSCFFFRNEENCERMGKDRKVTASI